MNGSRMTFSVIATLFVGLVLWSANFEVDQVIRAEAQVVPVQDVVKVQNRFPGTLERVQVRLGQRVDRGQILFELDPEDSAIDLTKTLKELAVTQAKVARLRAQVNGGEPVYPTGTPSDVVASQTALLLASRAELLSREQLFEAQQQTLALSIEEALAAEQAARRQQALIQEEIEIVRPLVEANAEPKIRLIQLRRELNDLLERGSTSALTAQRLRAEIDAVKRQSQQAKQQYLLQTQESLAQTEREAASLSAELERAGERAARSTVLSPVSGVVTALPFAVVGEIADAGTILAEVVPSDTRYQVEAKVRPMDIGSISPGQKARLSLAAYDFADFGHIDVSVLEVAQNITEPQQGEPFYKTLLEIQSNRFSKTGDSVALMPGLLGQIDILGEPVTVLSYVTKPVARVGSRALTEQ